MRSVQAGLVAEIGEDVWQRKENLDRKSVERIDQWPDRRYEENSSTREEIEEEDLDGEMLAD
jgi:hypothetical protein